MNAIIDFIYNALPVLSVIFFIIGVATWLHRNDQIEQIKQEKSALETTKNAIDNSNFKNSQILKDIEKVLEEIESKRRLLVDESIKLEHKRDDYKIFDI